MQHPFLTGMDKEDGLAFSAGPAGTADPVDIGLVVERNIEVDHMADPFHIQTPGGHIGGHQDVELAAFKLVDGA